MENLQRMKLKACHRVRGFMNVGDKKTISGSFTNYSKHDIEIIVYNTGLIYLSTAIQINDFTNNCSYVIYCDTYEFAEVKENA